MGPIPWELSFRLVWPLGQLVLVGGDGVLGTPHKERKSVARGGEPVRRAGKA